MIPKSECYMQCYTDWCTHFFQGVMLAYILSTLCRRGPDGFLYVSPNLFPASFFITYIINNIMNGAWLLVAAREYLHAGLAIIFLMWVTLIICLVISHTALEKHMDMLRKFEIMKEAWMIRFMVQNGLGIYCGWITVATLLNLGIVLTHFIGLDMSLSGTICLGILAVEVAAWVILDFFVFHRFTNYLFSPYLVVTWAIVGSIANNSNPWQSRNTIITLVLLGVVIMTTIAKFALMILRHCRNNNKSREVIKPTTSEKPVV